MKLIFKEQIEKAPRFAKEFIEKVQQEFVSVDDASIEYTKCPDMRIRKNIVKGIGFINAVTIKWQPRNQRFVLATALNQGEVKSCGLPVNIHEQGKTLTQVFYLDKEIINNNMEAILDCLKYAHKNRTHGSHK